MNNDPRTPGIIHRQTQATQKVYWTFLVQRRSVYETFRNVETFSVGPSGVLTFTDPMTNRRVMASPGTFWEAKEQEKFEQGLEAQQRSTGVYV
jgi:hypothetical protein